MLRIGEDANLKDRNVISITITQNEHKTAIQQKLTCNQTNPLPFSQTKKHLYWAVVERRGWCWAMTSFGVDAYKASEKDLLTKGVNLHSTSEKET